MATVPYLYIKSDNPYDIIETEFLDELVIELFNGAQFITDKQRISRKLPKTYFDDLKKEISGYKDRLPMYDVTFNHIYLVYADNIYPRLYQDNYRFIDENFYQDLEKIINPTEDDKENLRILRHYDIAVLNKTYYQVFYESFVFNKYITSCRRPSYTSGMDHIQPYYSIYELYYLAYDWNLTTKSTLKPDEMNDLCKTIAKYDIPAKTLIDHQLYIYNSRAIGLVKHYSLYGSYYMNVYLRKYRCCLEEPIVHEMAIRNIDLENQIKIMIALIRKAPAFDKSHTVYRFVERDDYMQHLKIGDIYQDPSFMSTTRNPFYYQENYAFGYILIKITLPENIPGIGICIEAYSNFPREEEIVLPPTSKFKLISITEADESQQNLPEYQHILNKRVQKKYEFIWVGNDYLDISLPITLKIPNSYQPEISLIDLNNLLKDDNIKYSTMSERLKYFRDTYVNNFNNQFRSSIAGNQYTFNLESYNSNTVYKTFFYYQVTDGIMITSSNPKYGNINLMLELGDEIHVNYYFKYSVTDTSQLVDINRIEWIEWLSLLAYIVGSRRVVIHSNYIMHYDKNDTNEIRQMKTRYTFSQNIYQYLKSKRKMYDQFIEVVTPGFDYGQLDLLHNIKINDIIKSTDVDELYRISQKAKINTMAELYIYIVEKYPKLLSYYDEKMNLIYSDEKNPFKNVYYSLDAWIYLYNRDLIQQIPSEKEFKKGSFRKLIGDKKIPKFKNRLRTYLGSKA